MLWSGPRREDEESKPMKNKQEKSDPSIVAKRPANKPGLPHVDLWGSGAEMAEQREGTEGNTGEQHTCRTPSRESVSQGLERVREAAKQRKKERFTALLHHVTIDLLKLAYSWLKREAAPGVDGRTWQSYKQNLEVNLAELHSRIHRSVSENFVCGSQPEIKDGSDQEGRTERKQRGKAAGDRSGDHRGADEGLRAAIRSNGTWRDLGRTGRVGRGQWQV